MEVQETALDGVVVLMPRRFGDDRGYFSESWNKRTLEAAGLVFDFVQDNHSLTRARGAIRGLHYQAPPHAQTKLVRCTAGAIWDVVVDARQGSATYGHWVAEELSDENGKQLLAPKGFLHGFQSLTEDAVVQYKCDAYYHRDSDGAVLWSSAGLGIDWPISSPTGISEKDASAPDFTAWDTPFRGARS
ncbi:MAG: dTDP-4-dehydrorhamnose 3,5-epimerase [Pseudomonadota bacterium]